MSVFSSWLAGAPVDAAVEMTPESVAVAVLAARGPEPVVQGYAVEPLPAGALTASLTARNVVDREAVVGTLRAVLERLGGRPRRVALLVPDLVARVSLVRFDRVPTKAADLDQLVRWQVRKSAPFPVEEATLAVAPGTAVAGGGQEFVAVLARRDIIREYESACEEVGMHPGLVDLSTFGVVNLFLAADPAPRGDWLVVHVRPDYTSLAIMRKDSLVFFRNLSEGDSEALADVVHQTAMYHQDRLSGQGFTQVLLGGMGRTPGAVEKARRSLQERLSVPVQAIDPTRSAALTERVAATPELLAILAPLVGTLLRTRAEAKVGA